MVSLVEWAARRLIIIIVTTGTVSVIGGLVIGRYVVPDNGSNGPDTASVAPQTSPSATPPGVTPTLVPSPKPSSQPANTAATTSVPGVPTRINEFGIPVGYPHTEAGAVSACANYDRAYGNPANRTPSRVKDVFKSMALPEEADRLANTVISIDKENAKYFKLNSLQSPAVNWIGRVTGYTVRSYRNDEANITLWGLVGIGLYGNPDPRLAPHEGWGTDNCQVVWSSGDWKLKDASDGPWTPAITERAAESFRDFLLVGAGQ
ncbi:hypothetical protein ThrDRAFT_00095 [Frankia casuarinae]|uniref:DUF8175 domain-containing protein n=1 Tax=Frankia casuarinae (strain DSM 45818 / CECT 9043 / HFP020203 / CcI3) TaxID=106370 RepID=Q2JH11_FRACC|nr:hypothetical protein [Frankia casuarinae]ABD09431.1 hypothetical protein Francci3_0037 [Frankia casuarinae]EYT94171.1 hypothetical protein ThrDRAFT_00095 [Frankia casuarinae]